MYPKAQFLATLWRLANAPERRKKFEIQVVGERVYVLVRAEFNIEHGREGDRKENEFQLKGTNTRRVIQS